MSFSNKDALSFFTTLASDNPSEKATKFLPQNDASEYDANFILKYADPKSDVLDIGSGTGLLINRVYSAFGNIVCVEPFKEFADYIIKSDNITIEYCDILNFTTKKQFNLITLFGLIQYFSVDESLNIYKKVFQYLEDDGILIIKNQFGVEDTVVVSGYSQELQRDYYAQYRTIEEESALLNKAGFKSIVPYDIYPKAFNRWENTHYYALLVTKSNCCPISPSV